MRALDNGRGKKAKSKTTRRGKQSKSASNCAGGKKVNDQTIRATLRLLPPGLKKYDPVTLPFLLSYELLRESQSFTRALEEKTIKEYIKSLGWNWNMLFLTWDMPGIKSPSSLSRLFEYFPKPWLRLPRDKRDGFKIKVKWPLPVRGEDLLALVLETCLLMDPDIDDWPFSPLKPEFERGGADEGMYGMVPLLRHGMKYILMELAPMKSRKDLMPEFQHGLKSHLTTKQVTRADSIHKKLFSLVSRRLHKEIGGFVAIQNYLRSKKLPKLPCTEKTFYRNRAAGNKLVEEYDKAVERSLRHAMEQQKAPWDDP